FPRHAGGGRWPRRRLRVGRGQREGAEGAAPAPGRVAGEEGSVPSPGLAAEARARAVRPGVGGTARMEDGDLPHRRNPAFQLRLIRNSHPPPLMPGRTADGLINVTKLFLLGYAAVRTPISAGASAIAGAALEKSHC